MPRSRKKRIIPNEKLEQELRHQGYQTIAGLDEVGRGAWAGPLVVGAVALPANHRLLKLRDSKLLIRSERERLARRIKQVAVAWGVGVVEVAELNRLGLGQSLSVAAARAVDSLLNKSCTYDVLATMCKFDRHDKRAGVDYVLVDGKYAFRGLGVPQQAVVRGDQTVRAIAAASIIAKVERDRMMRTLHRRDRSVRRYRFDLNKGYPSPWHKNQLRRHGPSAHHRTGFAPIRAALTQPLRLTIEK